jgi:hypothetical protein
MSKKFKKFLLLKTENGAIKIRECHDIEHRFETPNGDGEKWSETFRDLKMGQTITVTFREGNK